MFLINSISSDPRQSQAFVIEDGSSFFMTVYFRPMQSGWFIERLVYSDFELKGMRVVNSPNMLRQFKNLIPFGLACFSTNNREPQFLEDFSSGASKLYVLTANEVDQFEAFLRDG